MDQHSQRDWVMQNLEKYEKPLLRFATTFVGVAQAPDVVQETFLKLCKQDREKIDHHVAAWLFTVCRNHALDIVRQRGKHKPLEDDVEHNPDSSPSLKVEKKESLNRMLVLLKELPQRQQQIITLKFQGGLSYKEIAETMELSVTNVGFILHQALKTMRERMNQAEVALLTAEGGAQ
jgi:RNA polymerase sigma factor (sigma-70 family)